MANTVLHVNSLSLYLFMHAYSAATYRQHLTSMYPMTSTAEVRCYISLYTDRERIRDVYTINLLVIFSGISIDHKTKLQ